MCRLCRWAAGLNKEHAHTVLKQTLDFLMHAPWQRHPHYVLARVVIFWCVYLCVFGRCSSLSIQTPSVKMSYFHIREQRGGQRGDPWSHWSELCVPESMAPRPWRGPKLSEHSTWGSVFQASDGLCTRTATLYFECVNLNPLWNVKIFDSTGVSELTGITPWSQRVLVTL